MPLAAWQPGSWTPAALPGLNRNLAPKPDLTSCSWGLHPAGGHAPEPAMPSHVPGPKPRHGDTQTFPLALEVGGRDKGSTLYTKSTQPLATFFFLLLFPSASGANSRTIYYQPLFLIYLTLAPPSSSILVFMECHTLPISLLPLGN